MSSKSSSPAAAPWLQNFRNWFHSEWSPVLFVVALVTVMHHLHWLGPLANFSTVVVSNFAAGAIDPNATDDPEFAVIVIDQNRFENAYRERTPLDRCTLLGDLASIVSHLEPRVIVVDFDLSSRIADHFEADGSPIVPTADLKPCEQKVDESNITLEQYLDRAAQHKPPVTLILAEPEKASTERLRTLKTDWMLKRGPSAQFGDATVELAINVAAEMTCKHDELAVKAFRAMGGRKEPCDTEHPNKSRRIDYASYLRRALRGHIEDLPFIAAEKRLKHDGVVFFGGAYGLDDKHLTPIGYRYGVEVHAARYATLLDQSSISEAIGSLLGDLVAAFAFSGAVWRAAHRYKHVASSLGEWHRPRRSAVMVGFVLTYVAMTMMLLLMAKLLIAKGVVIEPILIAFGLAIDGFIVAPWRELAHAEGLKPLQLRDIRKGFREDAFGAACFLACRATFCVVVISAVILTVKGD